MRCSIVASSVPNWLAETPRQQRELHASAPDPVLLVPLRARGAPLGLAQLLRYRSDEPFTDDDVLLAREIGSRAALSIDNAQRYLHL